MAHKWVTECEDSLALGDDLADLTGKSAQYEDYRERQNADEYGSDTDVARESRGLDKFYMDLVDYEHED